MKIRLTWLLVAAISFSIFSTCWAVEIGKTAPTIKAKQIDGHTFDLDNNAGNVVILNFWATWCGPCRQEMPALESYYHQHKSEGLRILAISMDDPADDHMVRQVMHDYSFAAAFKREADYKGYGRIWRMPTTFIIDRHGILRKDGNTGDPKVDFSMLDKIVTPLLQEAQ